MDATYEQPFPLNEREPIRYPDFQITLVDVQFSQYQTPLGTRPRIDHLFRIETADHPPLEKWWCCAPDALADSFDFRIGRRGMFHAFVDLLSQNTITVSPAKQTNELVTDSNGRMFVRRRIRANVGWFERATIKNNTDIYCFPTFDFQFSPNLTLEKIPMSDAQIAESRDILIEGLKLAGIPVTDEIIANHRSELENNMVTHWLSYRVSSADDAIVLKIRGLEDDGDPFTVDSITYQLEIETHGMYDTSQKRLNSDLQFRINQVAES